MGARRVNARVGVVLTAALLLLVGTACAPRSPAPDSWRDDARRATSDVHAALQSVRVALEQAGEGRVLDRYLRTVAVDAEEQAGNAASFLSALQPPPSERRRHTEVSTSLDDASSLLADVRIAVVAGHREQYLALLPDVKQAANGLEGLETSLRAPARDAPGGSG